MGDSVVTKGNSVEVWINDDDRFECDWGIIEHPVPSMTDDGRMEVGHLVVVYEDIVLKWLVNGPTFEDEGIASVTVTDSRTFLHLVAHNDRQYVWELYQAHWADGD